MLVEADPTPLADFQASAARQIDLGANPQGQDDDICGQAQAALEDDDRHRSLLIRLRRLKGRDAISRV